MTISATRSDQLIDPDLSVSNIYPDDDSLTEFELALMRAHKGFERWQEQSLALFSDLNVSGAESALLHIIRLHERPKTIKELARLTNRDDIPNIQYSLRKLAAAGLVSKTGSGRTGVTYSATDEGRRLTDASNENRRKLLVDAMFKQPDSRQELSDVTDVLNRLTGIFDDTVRAIAGRK